MTVVLAVICTSCAPFPFNYYAPEAPAGKTYASACKQHWGPPDTISFEKYGVKFDIKVSRNDLGIHVFIQFHVPRGGEVRFKDNVVYVAAPGSATPITARIKPAYPYTWKIDEPMRGSTEERHYAWFQGGGSETVYAWYASYADITMPKSEFLSIRFPEFTVNGQLAHIPEIKFQRRFYLEPLMPLNC
ncbi:MAG: hypothetical protein ACYDBW_08170 [Sulfuricaulis sp.]